MEMSTQTNWDPSLLTDDFWLQHGGIYIAKTWRLNLALCGWSLKWTIFHGWRHPRPVQFSRKVSGSDKCALPALLIAFWVYVEEHTVVQKGKTVKYKNLNWVPIQIILPSLCNWMGAWRSGSAGRSFCSPLPPRLQAFLPLIAFLNSKRCRPGICLQDQGCKEDPFLVVNIPFCVSLTITFRERESSGGLGLLLLACLVFRAFTSGPCSSCASLPFKGHLGSVPSGWSTVKKSFSSFVDCIVFVFRFIDIMLNHWSDSSLSLTFSLTLQF